MKTVVILIAVTLTGCAAMNRPWWGDPNSADYQRRMQMIGQGVQTINAAKGTGQPPPAPPAYTHCSRDLSGQVYCVSR